MNVLLIAVDSLRADRLGCYGAPRDTSPFLDSLARQGVLFEKMYAPVVPTQPSFTTLFTGKLPTAHGIVAHQGRTYLNERHRMLPELLRPHGITTVAVDNLYDHKNWFARGFEFYINPRIKGEHPSCFRFNRRAVEWLQTHPEENFFLYIHYWDPHTPYVPQPQYRHLFYDGDPTTKNRGSLDEFYRRPLIPWWKEKWLDVMAAEWDGAAGSEITDIEFVRAMYDSSVRCVDDGIAELVGALEAAGRLDDTLVVILGDHGEELGEHGIYFDHHGLYESNIHVPLIIAPPARKPASDGGRTVPALCQHTDIAPTILDCLGIDVPEDMMGHSLRPFLDGKRQRSYYPFHVAAECTWMAKWALRTDRYKLIRARKRDFHRFPLTELYDLKKDPGEQHNIAAAQPDVTAELTEKLEGWISDQLAQHGLKRDPVLAHGITLGKRMFGVPDHKLKLASAPRGR